MRWLLALSLALHFSGLPAAGGAVCSPSRPAPHACCQRPAHQPGESMTGHCGCAMVPGTPAEERAPVSVVPDARDLAAAAAPSLAAGASGAVPVLGPPAPPAPHGPPGSASFLSGAGFRC